MARLITLWVEDGQCYGDYCEKRHFYDTRMSAEEVQAELKRIQAQKVCDLVTIEYSGTRKRAETQIAIKVDTRPQRTASTIKKG